MRVIRVALVCGVLTISSGCLFQKKPKIQVPVVVPPSAATPEPIPAPEQPPVQVPVQTPPATTTPPPDTPKPSPFPPAPSTTPPGRATNPAPSRPTPVAPAPTTPAPALGAILSADQKKRLDAEYVADLSQANQVLGRLSVRNLTPDQLDSVSRARAFIRQAGQFHDRDLATAAELARRARVLAQDLASALK